MRIASIADEAYEDAQVLVPRGRYLYGETDDAIDAVAARRHDVAAGLQLLRRWYFDTFCPYRAEDLDAVGSIIAVQEALSTERAIGFVCFSRHDADFDLCQRLSLLDRVDERCFQCFVQMIDDFHMCAEANVETTDNAVYVYLSYCLQIEQRNLSALAIDRLLGLGTMYSTHRNRRCGDASPAARFFFHMRHALAYRVDERAPIVRRSGSDMGERLHLTLHDLHDLAFLEPSLEESRERDDRALRLHATSVHLLARIKEASKHVVEARIHWRCPVCAHGLCVAFDTAELRGRIRFVSSYGVVSEPLAQAHTACCAACGHILSLLDLNISLRYSLHAPSSREGAERSGEEREDVRLA
jgi:hypothetical protein